jgi:hypothetical protein
VVSFCHKFSSFAPSIFPGLAIADQIDYCHVITLRHSFLHFPHWTHILSETKKFKNSYAMLSRVFFGKKCSRMPSRETYYSLSAPFHFISAKCICLPKIDWDRKYSRTISKLIWGRCDIISHWHFPFRVTWYIKGTVYCGWGGSCLIYNLMNFWAQFLSFSGHSSIAYVFLARWPEKADTTSDRFAEDNDTMFIILRITNTI